MEDTIFHKGDHVRVINRNNAYYNKEGEIFIVDHMPDGGVEYSVLFPYVSGKGKNAKIKYQSVAGFNHKSLTLY